MNCYVYIYSDKQGKPFYVGIGTNHKKKTYARARNVKNHHYCKGVKGISVRIVADDLTKAASKLLESILITEYRKHFPLVNRHEGHHKDIKNFEVARNDIGNYSIRKKPSGEQYLVYKPFVSKRTGSLCLRYWSRLWPNNVQNGKLIWYYETQRLEYDGRKFSFFTSAFYYRACQNILMQHVGMNNADDTLTEVKQQLAYRLRMLWPTFELKPASRKDEHCYVAVSELNAHVRKNQKSLFKNDRELTRFLIAIKPMRLAITGSSSSRLKDGESIPHLTENRVMEHLHANAGLLH